VSTRQRVLMERFLLAALLSSLPSAVRSQTCMGKASFADRRAQIGADANFETGARSASGSLGVGAAYGPFASVGFGVAHDDAFNDDATIFEATAGIGAPLRPKPKIQICPFISAAALNGAKGRDGVRFSSHAFGFGGSAGVILSPSRRFELVPFVTALAVTQTNTFRLSPITTVENDNHYAVSVGAGFVLAEMITIRPSTTFIMAQGQTTQSFGLHFAVGIGAVRYRARPADGTGSLVTVWVNTRAKVYYCPGSRWYGGTAYGRFMTEREAVAAGATPQYRKRCETAP
jgi:hypothetical protein